MRAYAVAAIVTAIICGQIFGATPAATAQQVGVRPSPIPANGPVLVSMLQVDPVKGFTFIELWNTSAKYEDLSELQVELHYTEIEEANGELIYHDKTCQLVLSGYIEPKRHVTFAAEVTNMTDVYQIDGCVYSGKKLVDVQIVVARHGVITEHVRIPQASNLSTYERKATGSYRTGNFATDFKANSAAVPRVSTLYDPPRELPLIITEIFPNAYLCSPGDDNPLCRSYVKVTNTGSTAIDLAGLRLRNGRPDASASANTVSMLSGVILPGEFRLLSVGMDGKDLAINSTEGATWFEDKYGLVRYDNTNTPYEKADLAAHEYRAWAYDAVDRTWKWTTPAPDKEVADFVADESTQPIEKNVAGYVPCAEGKYRSPETNRCRTIVAETTGLQPCKDGQYRSEETNRCRTVALTGGTLASCKDGQYRSEETNRCRSITTATVASLKPCAADQVRNPDTNRCKKIASAESTLKPCAAGQERNPETNRCRKVQLSAPAVAGYAVEPIKQPAAVHTMKWWALGGVMTVAAGYGVWEWRLELRKALARVVSFATGRK